MLFNNNKKNKKINIYKFGNDEDNMYFIRYRLKHVIIILILFFIFTIFISSNHGEILKHRIDNSLELIVYKKFKPGYISFVLIKTKRKLDYSIEFEYLKFPFFKISKFYYLAFYSINIPYNKKYLKLKIVDNKTKKMVYMLTIKNENYFKKNKSKVSKYMIEKIIVNKKMNTISSKKSVSQLEREFFQKIYTKVFKLRYITFPFYYPVKNPVITSKFGKKRNYYYNNKLIRISYHYGVDFKGTKKTKVYATNNGVVRFAGFKTVRGRCIVIDHGFGIYTTYFHLSRILIKKGRYVKKGQVIGYMGDTGYATGVHLHYELRINNALVDGIDVIFKTKLIKKLISKKY